MHLTTLAAKEITSAFYAESPSWSYYAGCSTGGRQGLVEAQLYPEEFDGILVGDPVVNQAALEGLSTLKSCTTQC
jgi:feruloyl esterase